MSLDIPQTILKPFETLVSNPAFCSQISNYTKDGLKALYGLEQEDGYCPSYFLLALNYLITNNLQLNALTKYLPPTTHQAYLSACQEIKKKANKYSDDYQGKQFDDNSLGVQTLVGVTWEMGIEYGKQFWRIQLQTSEGKIKKLRVEYQAMAMVLLKLNQALQHVGSIDVKKLPL